MGFKQRAVLVTASAAFGALAVVATPATAQTSAPTVKAAPHTSATSLGFQSCGIAAHPVTRTGPIKGSVTTKDCRGWAVWYGMMVYRGWLGGWTTISRRDILGEGGRHTYTIKACKLGTYTYKMWISKRGGFLPSVTTLESAPVRRKC